MGYIGRDMTYIGWTIYSVAIIFVLLGQPVVALLWCFMYANGLIPILDEGGNPQPNVIAFAAVGLMVAVVASRFLVRGRQIKT